ncbi:ABC transporter ATP-binding protein [Rhodocyclus tenuis]|uniref:ABC transporter ATP-binding protein n=2 Tax=Rhodocyclus TaxID=1064 RepID=A0A6L5JXK0_RHOTE|nr:ABC transporter ATP-binding protein [Rhodocyclus gracilis]MQY52055.1 ATP-binding cassette domain-containing protein [Rhodocyclus gracilis]NJA89684.1 ABC transporter ATP-binding protein [Rhodocyclus gracilis]
MNSRSAAPIPPRNGPLLEFDALRYRYDDGTAGLDGCSLSVQSGSRNALIGANGSGKTTLFLHANGLLRPEAGEVRYAGTPLDYRRAGLRAARTHIGIVFQNPEHQLFSANVREDVSFGPLNLGLDTATVSARVDAALAAVGMQTLAERPVHNLSFGQKKRVAIAGVLAMQPRVLLLDEPMAGLDARMQDDLLALLERLHHDGMTILLATHDIDFAYRWADQIHLMAAGRCTATLATASLAEHADALAAAGLRLPDVIHVQRALVAHGVLPASAPAATCLSDLLARLERLRSNAPSTASV